MTKVSTMKFIRELNLIEVAFTLFIFYLYLTVTTHFIPEGVNKTFLLRMNVPVLYLTLILVSVAALRSLIIKSANPSFIHYFESAKLSDVLLILLPITPIVQYIMLNQDTLSIYGSLYLLVVFMFIGVVVVVALPVFFSVIGSRVIFMSLGLALTFLLFYMSTLSLENSWYEQGSLKIQLPILFSVFMISYYVYQKDHRFLKAGVVIFFISNTLITLSMSYSALEEGDENNHFLSRVTENPMLIKPDIYLLTYDSYVGNETMLQYGIDNSSQENYLKSNGFNVYEGVYSIGGSTISTMARVLDASSILRMSATGGNSYVHNTLRDQGYTLAGISRSTGFWNKAQPNLDYYYPESSNYQHKIILSSILKGEFNFNAPVTFGKTTVEEFIGNKRSFMKSSLKPKFLYTHTGPGHSQNSGKCRVNEVDLFKTRLIKSNEEMREDIEVIQNNNPDALIIINGDHGPYLTGNCTSLAKGNFMPENMVSRLDIQDRFGTFLAIKWPKSLDVHDKDIIVLQDVFPAVFATLLKDESILSEVRVSPVTEESYRISGVVVEDGMIIGGADDGLPLYSK